MNFTAIWDKHKSYLFNFIKKRVNSAEDGEDILHEVALKFHIALNEKEIQNHKAWLFQVARNTIVDYYRTVSKNPESTQTEISDTRESHANNTCVCDLTGFVIQHYLPEKYSKALFMADIENIPQKEIANTLNLSHSAAKSRIQRARKLLKERVENCLDITFKSDGSVSDFKLKNECVLPTELVQEIERLNISM